MARASGKTLRSRPDSGILQSSKHIHEAAVSNVYRKLKFDGLKDRDSGRLVEGAGFEECEFEGCVLSITEHPELRTVVRNVVLRDCSVRGCSVYAAILDNVVVENLKCYNLLMCCGAAVRHVTLRGIIGQVMFSPLHFPSRFRCPIVPALLEHNRLFYRSVDWAIDVREAQVRDLGLAGIPGRLIRRDPANSIHLSVKSVANGDWRAITAATPCGVAIERMFDYSLDDIVVLAPCKGRYRQSELDAYAKLRDAGMAEPDSRHEC
ncbi:MAG: hypothetical protein U0638_11805 [Phycisphaerales bacterium]